MISKIINNINKKIKNQNKNKIPVIQKITA